MAIRPGWAGEQSIDTGEGLIKQGNEIVLQSNPQLHILAILPVTGFQ